METYSISAPYWLSGRKNVDGLAIADEISRRLNDADRTTERQDYEAELQALGENAELYGLHIEICVIPS